MRSVQKAYVFISQLTEISEAEAWTKSEEEVISKSLLVDILFTLYSSKHTFTDFSTEPL